MKRIRSTASPAEQEGAILKAAVEEIELVGLGRANLDMVARSAGVSRSTLYRRFPNRDALLTAVGRWTFETAMQRLSTISVGAGPQDAAVAAFGEGLRLLTTMPVLRQFLHLDAGTVIVVGMVDEDGEHVAVLNVGDSRVYLFAAGELRRLTEDHSLVETLVAKKIYVVDDAQDFLVVAARAMAEGLRLAGAQMPDAHLQAVAELHIRLACSFAQVPTVVLDVDDQEAVRDYARRHLAPLVW